MLKFITVQLGKDCGSMACLEILSKKDMEAQLMSVKITDWADRIEAEMLKGHDLGLFCSNRASTSQQVNHELICMRKYS